VLKDISVHKERKEFKAPQVLERKELLEHKVLQERKVL
jgi:hypothetical protein